MKFPYKVIESKIASQEKFLVCEGHHPTHALLFLKAGRFEFEIEGKSESVGAGDCVVFPDYIFFRRKILEPITFLYIKFSSEENCPYSFSLPFGKIKFKDRKRFFGSAEALEALIGQDDPLSVSLQEHLFREILFQIYREKEILKDAESDQPCRDQLVAAAAEYIEEHLAQKIRVQEICASIGTNASTLNFKFHREFSLAIGQYITQRRLKRAEHFLASSAFSITEIAARCGFENVYYFSNAFKKNCGIAPSAYRKKNQPL
jgi:AraC-like DNA-binding protein